jgi:hypothetical protein
MATYKQKLALANMVENGGNVSKAMRDAGYSPQTAKSPSKLTDSTGFRELMDAYLPDDMLLRALSDDIEEKKANRKAELELAFKLKGKMTERVDHTTDGKALQTFTNEQLDIIFNRRNTGGTTSS